MNPAAQHRIAWSASSLAEFDALLDARSPAEFTEDHVPGAVSCPVLDDAERAQVGTLYTRESPFAARRIGAALVARNIAHLLETTLADRPRTWRPLVYCWRGGKRSAALAHVLREVGWAAWTLEGGYKAYRRYVVERLAELPGTFTYRVIHGVTGSGKSRLLRALARAGAQVLDLEELAAHRGSVLGDLPERVQPSQKRFESRLLSTLAQLDRTRPVYVEAESRRIGQLQVPTALIATMRASGCVLLEAGIETRIALLMDEYRHFFNDQAALGAQLDCLAELHGRERIEAWKQLAASGDWQAFVARLLEEHYDPAYRRSAARNFVRLPEAAIVRIPSADEASFERLAGQIA